MTTPGRDGVDLTNPGAIIRRLVVWDDVMAVQSRAVFIDAIIDGLRLSGCAGVSVTRVSGGVAVEADMSEAQWIDAIQTAVRVVRLGVPQPSDSAGFPEVWGLFAFLLDRHTRERVFEPAYEDLLAMHLEACEFTGKWARRWLRFAFAWRTLYTFGECLVRMLARFPLSLLGSFLPEVITRWWRS
jgi:hypothetical protein